MQLLKKITIKHVLCLYIILCPILDILSFAFRNYFNTNISISTFLRPIIPVMVSWNLCFICFFAFICS